MTERVLLTHDPTETIVPWRAEVYHGNTPTEIRGYGQTKEDALEAVREKWAALDTKQPDEWVDL